MVEKGNLKHAPFINQWNKGPKIVKGIASFLLGSLVVLVIGVLIFTFIRESIAPHPVLGTTPPHLIILLVLLGTPIAHLILFSWLYLALVTYGPYAFYKAHKIKKQLVQNLVLDKKIFSIESLSQQIGISQSEVVTILRELIEFELDDSIRENLFKMDYKRYLNN
ncbi:MAG: hypothetical protein ACFFBD_29720 [Candidatus Hodarchaeota archaeon]